MISTVIHVFSKFGMRKYRQMRKLIIFLLSLAVLSTSYLAYTIVNQQEHIEQLQEQLQQEQLKIKAIYSDKYVREAIESGG